MTCEGGVPQVTLVRDGLAIAPDTPLSVVTSEFLSAGGAGYFPEMENQFSLQLDMPMRESVVAVLKSQEEGIRDGRVGSHDATRKRIRVPGGTYPVRCDVPRKVGAPL